VWPSKGGVLSLSATGPDLPIGQAGAGRGDECVASIDPIDVSNRDEVGVGDILTSTSPAERTWFPAAFRVTGTARIRAHWTVGRQSIEVLAGACATKLLSPAKKLSLRR
jgi:hypothetical protein